MEQKTLRQVIHKRCKGVIIVVAGEENNLILCCRKCETKWDPLSGAPFPFPARIIMADDMRKIKDKESSLYAGNKFII